MLGIVCLSSEFRSSAVSVFIVLRIVDVVFDLSIHFFYCNYFLCFFFFQAEDGIRDLVRSRGLGDVYKRQASYHRHRSVI